MNEDTPRLDEIAILEQMDTEERRVAAERAGFLEIMGAVVEALPDALLIVNEDGLITLANAQAELIFNYHRDQMVGQTVEMLLPDRFRNGHLGHRVSYFFEPRVRAMGDFREIMGRRRDGKEVAVEIMLAPVITRSGTYALAVVRRKRNG